MSIEQFFQYGVPTGLLLLVVWLTAAKVLPFLAGWLERIIEAVREVGERMEKRDERWEVVIKEMHANHRESMEKLHQDHMATMSQSVKEIRADRQEDREVRHDTNKAFQTALLQFQDVVEQTVAPVVEHVAPLVDHQTKK